MGNKYDIYIFTLITVWGILMLASLAGTRSASSLPFHWKKQLSVPSTNFQKYSDDMKNICSASPWWGTWARPRSPWPRRFSPGRASSRSPWAAPRPCSPSSPSSPCPPGSPPSSCPRASPWPRLHPPYAVSQTPLFYNQSEVTRVDINQSQLTSIRSTQSRLSAGSQVLSSSP